MHSGHLEKAAKALERAASLRRQNLFPDHPDVATSLHNLALLYREQGKYNEAEPLIQRSLAIREEKALAPDHPSVATGLNNLGGLLRDKGHYADGTAVPASVGHR
jgi:tetratricopeptide (TPR) repeat protein